MVELLFFVPLLVVLGLKVSLGGLEHGKAQPAFWAGAKLRAVPMKKGNPVPQQPRSPTFWLLSAFSSVFLSLCAVWLTTLISVMFNLTPKLALNKATFHKMPIKKTCDFWCSKQAPEAMEASTSTSSEGSKVWAWHRPLGFLQRHQTLPLFVAGSWPGCCVLFTLNIFYFEEIIRSGTAENA